jgi:hypothetical protein
MLLLFFFSQHKRVPGPGEIALGFVSFCVCCLLFVVCCLWIIKLLELFAEMSGLSISIIPDIVDERKKRLRGGRFKEHLGSDGFVDEPEPSPSKSPRRLKGVSSRIEKPYFRLTSAPKISQVRPLPVLKKSLEHVKNKYSEDEDYSYCCEQVWCLIIM